MTAGQTHDSQIVDRLLDHLGPCTIVLADNAYDADRIRELIQEQGATPNIPPEKQPQVEAVLQQTALPRT